MPVNFRRLFVNSEPGGFEQIWRPVVWWVWSLPFKGMVELLLLELPQRIIDCAGVRRFSQGMDTASSLADLYKPNPPNTDQYRRSNVRLSWGLSGNGGELLYTSGGRHTHLRVEVDLMISDPDVGDVYIYVCIYTYIYIYAHVIPVFLPHFSWRQRT